MTSVTPSWHQTWRQEGCDLPFLSSPEVQMLPSSTQSHDLGIRVDSSPWQKKRLAKTKWMEMDGWSYCYRYDDTRRKEHFLFQKWGGRQTHRMLSRQRRENSVHSTFSTSKEWKRKGVNYVSRIGMLIMVAVGLFFFFWNKNVYKARWLIGVKQDFWFHMSFVMHQDKVNNDKKRKKQTTANQDIHKWHDKFSGTCYAAICHSVNALLLRREQRLRLSWRSERTRPPWRDAKCSRVSSLCVSSSSTKTVSINSMTRPR